MAFQHSNKTEANNTDSNEHENSNNKPVTNDTDKNAIILAPHASVRSSMLQSYRIPAQVTIMVTLSTDPMSVPRMGGGATAKTNVTCFRCGESGHYRAACHHYRVRMCSNYRHGICTEGSACFFAHSEEELRQPWLSKCVRVVKTANAITILGCGAIGHTYRTCTRSWRYDPNER